jgi:thioredoxin reductase (NADPH)
MRDIVIIGGGPAGMTAALYAIRAGKTALLLEGESIGGQIAFAPRVENYPGIPRVGGLDFSNILFEQVSALGTEFEPEKANRVRPEGGGFRVETGGGDFLCKSVVLATGVKRRKLGLPGEERFTGRGVSYCAVCDGAFYKGKNALVVGGGNTALADALYLSDVCRSVTLLHRRDSFRGEASRVSALRQRENVGFRLRTEILALTESGGAFTGVTARSADTGEILSLPADVLFAAVGHVPENGAFADLVKLDEYGYIDAGEDTKTSAPGVFAAGDCRKKTLRQLTTAVADGAAAGTAAAQFLSGQT